MEEDPEIIYSPFSQRIEMNGECVHIRIYRIEGTDWSLEVEDEYGNSTVWDDLFKSDHDALIQAKRSIKIEGIEAFVGAPS